MHANTARYNNQQLAASVGETTELKLDASLDSLPVVAHPLTYASTQQLMHSAP